MPVFFIVRPWPIGRREDPTRGEHAVESVVALPTQAVPWKGAPLASR
jgi:hypothetical protein